MIEVRTREHREHIPKHIRDEVKEMFDSHCAYCGIKLRSRFCVDHVIPVAKGGPNVLANYFPACGKCNGVKGSYSVEDFRKTLEEQVLKKASIILAERFGTITIHPKKIVFFYETLGHKFDEELVKAYMAKGQLSEEN